MTRNFVKIAVCCLLLTLPLCAVAQKTGSVSGRVSTPVKHAEYNYMMNKELPGATVMLVTQARDTLYKVTDRYGVFTWTQIPQGQSILKISFVGYETRIDTVQVVRNTLLEYLTLKEEAKNIDEVVVSAAPPLVTRNGDTTVYHAAAVRTLAGDEAIRIVEQLPGAELSADGLKVQDEPVARSYVNGKLLFGDDAMSALNNLKASDVVKIRVYDETTDEDRRSGYKQGRKQKVMDVVTRKPIFSSVTGHFLASVGSDMDKGGDGNRRLRYGVGTTDNFFSEKLLVAVDAYANNIARRSNRLSQLIESPPPQSSYSEDIYAKVDLSRFWGDRRDGSSLKGGYSFSDNATEQVNVTRRRYFETVSNPAMEYSDTTSSNNKRYSHKAYLDVDLHGVKSKFLKGFQLNSRFSYDTSEGSSARSMNTKTERGVEYTNTLQNNRNRGYSISEELLWQRYDNPRLPTVGLSARIADDSGTGWRMDTLSSSQTRKVLESSSSGVSQQYEWLVAVPLLDPRRYSAEDAPKGQNVMVLQLSYEGSYEHSRKRKLSLNIDDELNPVDVANTMDYTYNYLSNNLSLGFGYGNWERWMFYANASMSVKSPLRQDRYPVDYTYRKHFATPNASLSLSRSHNGTSLSFMASMRSDVPSLEQITARIDDTNPLLLTAGNSGLRATQHYSVSASWRKTLDLSGKSFGLSASARFVRNAVTTRSRYFAEPTRLPEWENYLTQANATLTTFENVSGDASANFRGYYSFRMGSWATLRTTLSGAYSRRRAYVGEALSTTHTYAPSLDLYMNGVVARKLRYSLGGGGRFSYSENTVKDASRNLGWNASVSLDYNPLEWLFAGVFYTYVAQRFYTRTGTNNAVHLLNAIVGCKFNKGAYTISVSVYDVLNKGVSFRSSMQANYMLDTYTPSFGRYYLVNFGIKFNKTRGAKGRGAGSS